MGKLLRVLVILLVPLSAGALILGMQLFGKRELLKARTQKLEQAIVALATTIEAEAPQPESKTFPARDMSPVTSAAVETPETSDFWNQYRAELEEADHPKLKLDDRRAELMNYYKMSNGKPLTDAATGMKVTKGPGTMQAVLDDLQTKAMDQYNRLNETRGQLAKVREELVSTIEDLNKQKADHRLALKETEARKAEIESMKAEIDPLKQKLQQAEEEKKVVDDKVADQTKEMAAVQEEAQGKDDTIAQLKKELDAAKAAAATLSRKPAAAPEEPGVPVIIAYQGSRGLKGKVVSVNKTWNFAILELTDDCLKELLGPDLSLPAPLVDLFIKRGGASGKFVTKVRITQVRKDEKLAIADILTDWQQSAVKEGDEVFF